MYHRMLLAVDGSDASEKEVEYVAEMVSKREDLYLHLMHVLPPSTSAEGEGTQEGARGTLEALRQRLCDGGVAADRVDIGTIQGGTDATLADTLLDAARDQECGTIVVGRHSLPWYREMLHQHPADELVKRARGVAVWVVE